MNDAPRVHAVYARQLFRKNTCVGYSVMVKCPYCGEFHFHGKGRGLAAADCGKGCYHIEYDRLERYQL